MSPCLEAFVFVKDVPLVDHKHVLKPPKVSFKDHKD